MYRVTKRDGKIVDFEISKISDAITKAFDSQQKQYNQSVIDFLALKVTADFEPKIKDELIAVEDIQDSVERVLSQAGYTELQRRIYYIAVSVKSCAVLKQLCLIIKR